MKKQLFLVEVDANDLQDNAALQGVASEEQACLAALSKVLQVTMLDVRAWDRAVERGYIVVRAEGGLEWTLGSATLLAYFCGRLWSGDRGMRSRGRQVTVWVRGERAFPATELQGLFGQKALRKLRQNRDGRHLPEHADLIDELFLSDY